MITTATFLQTLYNKLYAEFRNYVWEFDIVELLSDLEIEVYQVFPDVDKLNSKFQKLKRQVSFTDAFQDDSLKDVFINFENAICDIDRLYADLRSFKEVITL